MQQQLDQLRALQQQQQAQAQAQGSLLDVGLPPQQPPNSYGGPPPPAGYAQPGGAVMAPGGMFSAGPGYPSGLPAGAMMAGVGGVMPYSAPPVGAGVMPPPVGYGAPYGGYPAGPYPGGMVNHGMAGYAPAAIPSMPGSMDMQHLPGGGMITPAPIFGAPVVGTGQLQPAMNRYAGQPPRPPYGHSSY